MQQLVSGPSQQVWSPHGLWSLGDMLKVSATAYLKLGRRIEEGQMILFMVEHANIVWNDQEKGRVRKTMRSIHKHASALKLETTEEVFAEWIEHDNLPQTTREWELMTAVVTKELSRKLFLFVPSHVSKYYQWEGILSEAAALAFPKAHRHLVEAGSCLAAGRYVACVFHSMLAAEAGVRVFGTALRVDLKGPIEYAQWETILSQIQIQIQKIENTPKSPERDADLSFFGEGAAQFRFFKNGWRMKTAHGRGEFDEPGAVEAIDHVRSFFEIISKRLKEDVAA